MSNGRPLRAGIIGCGGIVQEGHIPSLLAAGVEIGAVCDANEARAKEVAKRFAVLSFEPCCLPASRLRGRASRQP